MPFQTPRHQHALSDSQYSHDNFYGAANAIYATGQTLSSIGSPTSHWPAQNRTDLQRQDSQTQNQYNAYGNGMSLPFRSNPSSYDPSALEAQTSFHTPRRSLTLGRRQVEELQLSQPGSAMSDVHHYGAPPAYGGDNVAINFQPSTPQQQSSSAASNPIPGNLQPGQPNRPPMMASSNTAPTLPTLPQISTQLQQPPLSARPSTLNHTHSYSRSTPNAYDEQKYKPFSNTPEQQKYMSPTSSNYMPQTPQGPPSYSPLGLADIRPRADTNFSDTTFSPSTSQDNDVVQYPANNNYLAPWPIYAADWCKWPPRTANAAGKIAIGSYLEDNHNYIQVLDAQIGQVDEDPHSEPALIFNKTAEATHAYPVTRILWEPPSSNKQTTDLLATSGDHLRLWSLPTDHQQYQSNSITRPANQPLQKLSPLALLSNSKSPEHTAPITSLDWNNVEPSLIITSSIDTTCTIWDIPSLTAKTQLIAHDKEVFDVRFCANSVDVFVSCGADGSVRMFDLRSLEHSTIIYEPSDKTDKSAQVTPDPSLSSSPTRPSQLAMAYPPPLLRIAASPHDAHLLATFSQDSSLIRVLDVRQPGQALLELKGHGASVNCIEWSSTQRGMLASGADDCCVLLWDLMTAQGGLNTGVPAPQPNQPGQTQTQGVGQERGPTGGWECGFEVSNLSWAPGLGQSTNGGTLGVCGGRGFWGVRL